MGDVGRSNDHGSGAPGTTDDVKRMARRAFPSESWRGRLVRGLRDAVRNPRAYRRARRVKLGSVKAAWHEWAAGHDDVVFVQIGAHDGDSHDGEDPIVPYLDACPGWRGILVEPIPEHFEALTRKRGDDPRVTLVRAAITNFDGMATMYMVETTDEMPAWADRLSSLDADVVANHRDIPNIRDAMHEVEVPAMTFDSLTCGLDRLDVLVTDTEGHDAQILDQFDLERWNPSVVIYESLHLSDHDFLRCERRFRRAGYWTTTDEDDTIAVRKEP
jgi:FkbM family methyltransferase